MLRTRWSVVLVLARKLFGRTININSSISRAEMYVLAIE